MTAYKSHISVCICTFKRAELLRRLLEALENQQTGEAFTFSIVVADNDAAESAKPTAVDFAARCRRTITYCSEPRQNIALARNKALDHATGDYIAFIDDDEFPTANWLGTLFGACEMYRSDGVLGPVRPHFDEPPPQWIVKGRFCERPEHSTGTVMPWEQSRTGNLLFKRSILGDACHAFNPEFGNGGEDKDFFMRMTQQGRSFIWCNEAVAYETVPPSRWKRSYMLKRALLRGKNILKHPGAKSGPLARSLAAVPLYFVVLPLLLLCGQHWFMKYCIKLCDHLGRILALAGLNPVSER